MRRITNVIIFGLLAVGWAFGPPQIRAAATLPASQPTPVLIHLPGISGELPIDHALVGGLVAGGVASAATIIDWTGTDRGVPALTRVDRHVDQSKRVATAIEAILAKDPATPIILVGHSGGTGIAVNALEDLPPTAHVRTLLLLCSALSPGYDLSAALKHVDGHAYNLFSPFDNMVLGYGTKTFGTYDRVFTEAAGKVGFTVPPTADKAEYAKLTQYPYDPAWTKYGNGGDHVGPTSRIFAKLVLAKLIRAGPSAIPPPATRPSDPAERPR